KSQPATASTSAKIRQILLSNATPSSRRKPYYRWRPCSGAILLARLQCGEHRMGIGRERIGDRHPAPSESVLHIFRKKEATSSFRCRREDYRVPDAELMINGKVVGGKHDGFRRLRDRKSVAPSEN